MPRGRMKGHKEFYNQIKHVQTCLQFVQESTTKNQKIAMLHTAEKALEIASSIIGEQPKKVGRPKLVQQRKVS